MKERKHNRLNNFDYSRDNLYYVTSCVQNRIWYFGEIISNFIQMSSVVGTGRDLSLQLSNDNGVSKKMKLNEFGEIAYKQWHWLAEQYPYVVLHEFVVMPNHIHGIIEINSSQITHDSVKIKSLSELIGAYKTSVSKKIHLLECCRDRSRPVPTYYGKSFAWQRSFHEHIIRNEKEFAKISEYILANPMNWHEDELF
jgi:REP element-mobilizing transposase RayT